MTNGLTIVGGCYREICLHPRWNQLFGSGVRAAASLSALQKTITAGSATVLHTWACPKETQELSYLAAAYEFQLNAHERSDCIEFQYDHSMAPPRILPEIQDIHRPPDLQLEADTALYFGLIESECIIKAKGIVYDPQSGRRARSPSKCGVTTERLAIVANLTEATAMAGEYAWEDITIESITSLSGKLLASENAEVVIIKNGTWGAMVRTKAHAVSIPSYITENVFSIGSGDVFSAIFAFHWLIVGVEPIEAANKASLATAQYCASRILPIPSEFAKNEGKLQQCPVPTGNTVDKKRVYLAGPLFTLRDLWLLNEAKRCLQEQGMSVFSPKDEVGIFSPGTDPQSIAEADLKGLEECNLVFAIVDGNDPGTIFEIGYARARGIPVVGYAERVAQADLTMLVGTGCTI